MTHRFHPLVWPVWALAAALAVAGNPLHNLLVIAAVGVVVSACHTDGPLGRSFGLFVRLGGVLIGLRAALSLVAIGGLTQGATPLGRLPALRLPAWAGGVALGGPFTLEMLVAGLAGGLRVWALLLVFGGFNAVADQYGLLRRTPRWLFGAGLVVTVALAWVPQMILHWQAVREAQRVRGLRVGWRGAAGQAVPLVIGSLERALQLAEAMDSRGYARTRQGRGAGVGAQLGLLAGATLVALGLFAALGEQRLARWGALAALAGLALLVLVVRRLGQTLAVTRYRPDHWRPRDLVVVAACGLALVAVAVLRWRSPALLAYIPLPRAAPPGFAPPFGGIALLLTAPAWRIVPRTHRYARS